MGEERFAVAVADAYFACHVRQADRRLHVMATSTPPGSRWPTAPSPAWEDSSPLLVITEGVGQGRGAPHHYDMAEALNR